VTTAEKFGAAFWKSCGRDIPSDAGRHLSR